MCLGCGYLLRGLPEPVCPECGRAFDIEDPSTYRIQQSDLKWRYWAAPPPNWHLILAIFYMILILNHVSIGGTPVGPFRLFVLFTMLLYVLSPFVIFGLFVDYCLRVIATYGDRCRSQLDIRPPPKDRRFHWFVTPLCIIIGASACITPWPLHLRFKYSRAEFESVASEYIAGRHANTGPQLIGLYYVDSIERTGNDTVGFCVSDSLADPVGFEYSPKNAAFGLPEERLAPHWCIVEW